MIFDGVFSWTPFVAAAAVKLTLLGTGEGGSEWKKIGDGERGYLEVEVVFFTSYNA